MEVVLKNKNKNMCKFICKLFKKKKQSNLTPPVIIPIPTPTPPSYNYYFATQYLDCVQNSAPGGYVIRTTLSPSVWICGTDDLQYQIVGTAAEGDYNSSSNPMDGDLLISSCSGGCA